MKLIKKYKKQIKIAMILLVVLIAAFLKGNGFSLNHNSDMMTNNLSETAEQTPEAVSDVINEDNEKKTSDTVSESHITAVPDASKEKNIQAAAAYVEEYPVQQTEQCEKHESLPYSEEKGMNIDEKADKDEHNTEPVPKDKPVPIEPEKTVISDKERTCILSVRCDTVLNNISALDDEKIGIIPEDGIIFAEQAVTFYEGESVFNLLSREMKKNKIHLEFANVPVYNSAYIEGIGNLYEFDCGELSGWMYKVNDWFPNYGCSRYQLNEGDKIEWIYTCDLGKDVGGDYSARNGN